VAAAAVKNPAAVAAVAVGPVVNPPGKATLTAPANSETCESGTSVSATQSEVTFTWSASADTDTYDLRVTNSNTSTVTNKTGLTSTSTKVTLDKGRALLLVHYIKELSE
jgi:hypothetical protein